MILGRDDRRPVPSGEVVQFPDRWGWRSLQRRSGADPGAGRASAQASVRAPARMSPVTFLELAGKLRTIVDVDWTPQWSLLTLVLQDGERLHFTVATNGTWLFQHDGQRAQACPQGLAAILRDLVRISSAS